ncbi:hypothetical protein L596_020794 [Steinernema carpocapsae]|uniref:Uncharacterized protein n=1 Tax=Steinernema carpocapsae TaxID=34508 RepID=A0A4U5MUL2_STECR|nr:hypothetical protein L596_020794 [Steinernema carpocapsae]
MAYFIDDNHLFLFFVVFVFCNTIPLFGLFVYLIASSFVLVGSAILAEVSALLFGLAFFVPIAVFATLSAVVITVVLLIARCVLNYIWALLDTAKENRDEKESLAVSMPFSPIAVYRTVSSARSSRKLVNDWDWPVAKKNN